MYCYPVTYFYVNIVKLLLSSMCFAPVDDDKHCANLRQTHRAFGFLPLVNDLKQLYSLPRIKKSRELKLVLR